MKSIVLHNPVEYEWFCNIYFIVRPLLRHEAESTFQTVLKFDEHEVVLYIDYDFFNHLKYLRQLEHTEYVWKNLLEMLDSGLEYEDSLLTWQPYPYEAVLELAHIPGFRGVYYVIVAYGNGFIAGQRDLHGKLYLSNVQFETIEQAKLACNRHFLALMDSFVNQRGCPPFLLSDFLENEDD